MNEIKILRTQNCYYYYNEEMKCNGYVFKIEHSLKKVPGESEPLIEDSINLISLSENDATIYELYQGPRKSYIETYTMARLIVDQYFKPGDFKSFIYDMAESRMSSSLQSKKENRESIYSWIADMYNDFIEDISINS